MRIENIINGKVLFVQGILVVEDTSVYKKSLIKRTKSVGERI